MGSHRITMTGGHIIIKGVSKQHKPVKEVYKLGITLKCVHSTKKGLERD